MQIAKILRRLLADHDMNISQLSRATGVPRQTLDNWLSGQDPKSLKQVKIVSNYFNMSVDELCFGPNEIIHSLNEYSDEINAGIFEVVLRRVKSKK